jgi:hypothetical protein
VTSLSTSADLYTRRDRHIDKTETETSHTVLRRRRVVAPTSTDEARSSRQPITITLSPSLTHRSQVPSPKSHERQREEEA